MSYTPKKVFAITAVLAVLIGAGGAAALARDNNGTSHKVTVDVAEDPSRFVFAGTHVIEEGELAGFPAYGDSFVTQGWIYPFGTLSEADPGADCDFNDQGLPTSCEPLYEPIGEWTCYGIHIGEGAATTEGSWVVTTQVFDLFDDDHGTIVTDGFESPEIGKTVVRAVTGGTGEFSAARGEHKMVALGLHPELFNVRSNNTINWRD